MASNMEMRRLVLHAADQLVDAPGVGIIADVAHDHVNGSIRRQAVRDLANLTAAIALAEQTLRMVGACLADDEPEASAAVPGVKEQV